MYTHITMPADSIMQCIAFQRGSCSLCIAPSGACIGPAFAANACSRFARALRQQVPFVFALGLIQGACYSFEGS